MQFSKMPSRRELLIVLSVLFSLLSSALNGLDMAFNTYALLLKETFNFTQTQVEITASMSTLGMGLCFTETIITATLGYKATFCIVCIATPMSCLAFSLLACYSDFASHNPVFVYITQLFLSCVNWIASLAIIRFNIELFPRSHTGKIIAVIWSMYCLAKIPFAGSMNFWHDLSSFFLSLAIASAIFFVPCFLLLHKLITISQEQPILEWARNGSKTDYEEMEIKDTTLREPEGSFSLPRSVFRSGYFHFMFWSTVAFYACVMSCMNNITAIADSAKVANPLSTVYLLSVSILIPRFSFGFIFDKFSSEFCGFALLAVCYFSFVAAMGIGMLWLTVHSVYLLTALVGAALGPSSTIAIAMLVARFGSCHISIISSSFYFFLAASQLLLQLVIGLVYDTERASRKTAGVFCQGKGCFFWSFCIMLVIAVLTAAVQVINYICATYFTDRKGEYSELESCTHDPEKKMLICEKQNGT